MIPKKVRDAVAEAMGYEVPAERVAEAVSAHAPTPTGRLRQALARLERRSRAAGGRSVELAEENDSLRIALAVRRVAGRAD